MIKICSKCKEGKDNSEYYYCAKSADKLSWSCKKCLTASRKIYNSRPENIKKSKVSRKIYSLKNKDNKAKYDKEYREKNYIEINKKRALKRKTEEYRKWKNESYHKKSKNDKFYKFKLNIRSRIYKAFQCNSWRKESMTTEILGCDFNTAKEWIENQFTNGMSWENQGEWHVDHIIPLAIADNTWELEALCYYKNLQPLWEKDNLRKGDFFE